MNFDYDFITLELGNIDVLVVALYTPLPIKENMVYGVSPTICFMQSCNHARMISQI